MNSCRKAYVTALPLSGTVAKAIQASVIADEKHGSRSNFKFGRKEADRKSSVSLVDAA